jgi:hypothetical protein
MTYFNKISLSIVIVVMVVTNINTREWFKNNSVETLAAYFAVGFGVGTVNAKISKSNLEKAVDEFNNKGPYSKSLIAPFKIGEEFSTYDVNGVNLGQLKDDELLLQTYEKLWTDRKTIFDIVIPKKESVSVKEISLDTVDIKRVQVVWSNADLPKYLNFLAKGLSCSNDLNNLATNIVSAGLVGYNAKEGNWWHVTAYAAGLGLRMFCFGR